MAKFQYDTTANQSDMIINGSSLLNSLTSKQIAITAVSPLLLDSSGNLSLDNTVSYTTNGINNTGGGLTSQGVTSLIGNLSVNASPTLFYITQTGVNLTGSMTTTDQISASTLSLIHISEPTRPY